MSRERRPDVVVTVRHRGHLTLVRSDMTRDQAARYVAAQTARGRSCNVTYADEVAS